MRNEATNQAEAESLIAGKLKDGEKIIWSGGTAKSRLLGSGSLISMALGPIVGVIVCLIAITAHDLYVRLVEHGPIDPLPYFVFGGFGVLLSSAMLANGYWLRLNRWFVLTDQRAILIHGQTTMRFDKVDLAKVKWLTVFTYADGSGTIAFQKISDMNVLAKLTMKEERSSETISNVAAFIDIENANIVCGLLQDQIPGVKVKDFGCFRWSGRERGREAELPGDAAVTGNTFDRKIAPISTLALVLGSRELQAFLVVFLAVTIAQCVLGLHPLSACLSIIRNHYREIDIIGGASVAVIILKLVIVLKMIRSIRQGLRNLRVSKRWALTTAVLSGNTEQEICGSSDGSADPRFIDTGYYTYQVNGRDFDCSLALQRSHRVGRGTRELPEKIDILYDPASPRNNIAVSDLAANIDPAVADEVTVPGAVSRLVATAVLVALFVGAVLLGS